MKYSAAQIAAIKAANPVDTVVAETVQLSKDGRRLVGKCPWHPDDSPSLDVNIHKDGGVWCCRVCEKRGGDVVAWVMQRDRVSFAEALRTLIARASLSMDPEGQKPKMSERYTYEDELGEPVAVVERWEPGFRGRAKTFVQKKRSKSGWVSGKSQRQVMYRLPNVLDAVARKETIYVVEGEKCVHALESAGATATTCAGGAKASMNEWTGDFAAPLEGAKVVVLPDCDDAGRALGKHIAQVLEDVANDVTVIELDGPKGYDVADWLSGGHSLRELRALADKAAKKIELRFFKFTDSGNAERFARMHGEDVRYCAAADAWYVWDKKTWRKDELGEVLGRTRDTVRAMAKEAAENESESFEKWAHRSESASSRRNMLSLVKGERGISVYPGDFDADPFLLVVDNGTLNLQTGELREHRRADLCMKRSPVVFDKNAKAPAFEKFLERTLPDPEVRGFMQCFFGYSMTGVVREHVFPICWGVGGNGKGTLFEAVRYALGDYSKQISSEVLLAKKETHPTGLADLMGLRLALASETDSGRALAEGTVKQLTGGDRISARFMRQDFFEFVPTHKLILATNSKPIVRGTDEGIWRRMRLIPFEAKVKGAEIDTRLGEKLKAEAAGILNWVLEGCLRWQKSGLPEPDAIMNATDAYREDQDVLGIFIEDRTHPEGHVKASDVYAAYAKWAEARGERALSQTAFGRQMTDRGFGRKKVKGHKVYDQLRLKKPHEFNKGDGQLSPQSQPSPQGNQGQDYESGWGDSWDGFSGVP